MPDLCNRCGKCCYVGIYPCRYLVFQNDKSFCRVYPDRLNRVTHIINGIVYVCKKYSDVDIEIKGCPLNTVHKPQLEVNL
jgi:hypothetical protein